MPTPNKLKNTKAFVKSYLNGKSGAFVLRCTYGRNPKHAPKVMAHAFKEAIQ